MNEQPNLRRLSLLVATLALLTPCQSLIVPRLARQIRTSPDTITLSSTVEEQDTSSTELSKRKRSLLSLLGTPSTDPRYDSVLACPTTKQALEIRVNGGPIVGGVRPASSGVRVSLTSGSKSYSGRTDSYLDLLNEATEFLSEESTTSEKILRSALTSLRALVPPPLRSALSFDEGYVPMRDLFTSPAVSFAYERGWRQGFTRAGFPGPEEEVEMVKDYFRDDIDGVKKVVVDMSCATGLFTRRLAKSGEYSRVIGCDFSESMLTEARRRITSDPDISDTKSSTRLELVRCDVANIPMQNDSVDALHAGAAMHCWPELQEGLNEIYRVLKPGGRYFASTFLSEYFSTLQNVDGGGGDPMKQAWNYFTSTDELRDMIVKAGFDDDKIQVDVLGQACVIIKAEKS